MHVHVHVYGTIYLHTLSLHRLYLHLSNDEKCTYSVVSTAVLTFNCFPFRDPVFRLSHGRLKKID